MHKQGFPQSNLGVDMLFVILLEKHVDEQSSSGSIIYLMDFLPCGGFSQIYTLIHDRL